MHEILGRLGSRPDVRLFRANVGAGRTFAGDSIRWGIKGQADLNGWVSVPCMAVALRGEMLSRARPLAIRLEIEVKRPGCKQTEEQRTWQAACERHGVIYILATSADEAEQKLEEALR